MAKRLQNTRAGDDNRPATVVRLVAGSLLALSENSCYSVHEAILIALVRKTVKDAVSERSVVPVPRKQKSCLSQDQ
jgi:hypothetical protein